MSKQVDERVVSMQFDNRQFERNVSTTMSTLDKLKRSLNLSGSAKGLEDINNAARNVNMSGLSGAIEQVSAKFSALQVIGITALANITNSAVEAGKRFVKALTIQPITTGFNEYELKMNSVQTIMASTGESIDTVNSYLEELNRYSDQTIYSFQDMTQNIGKFTNAGVKLEDAVAAIKGISNEAAVSGANANEASRAMYNFAQALSAGYVKLIDWKSIENANMATVEFKNQLIETAVSLGTVTKSADGLYKTLDGNTFNATKNFNEVLNDQWMTSEVLVETLKKYADETTEIGAKASKAATEVKTFSQLFDTLKESAQSGWAKTWEILIGDLIEAKGFLTTLSEFMGGVIDKMSDLRNNLLGGIFNSKWDKLNDKIEAAGFSTETFVEKLKEASKENGKNLDELIEKHGSLSKAIEAGAVSSDTIRKAIKKLVGVQDEAIESTEDLGKIVDEVIDGKWGNGEKRWKALTEAGYDWVKVQNEVNKRYGATIRHVEEVAKAQGEQLSTLVKLSDEQLKSKGYTDEQIKALRELESAAEGSKTSIDDLIDSISQPSGRTLLFKTVENFLETIKGLLGIVKQSWDDAFGDPDRADKIYGFIEVIYDFSESLKELASSEGTVTTVKKIVDGIMAALDVSWYMFSGSLVATIKLATAVLGLFGTNLVEVSAYIADLIIKFRDWVKENTMFINMGNKLAEIIFTIIKGFKRLFDAFTSLNIVSEAATKIWDKLKEIFGRFSLDFKGLGLEGAVATIDSLFDIVEKWIKKLDGSEAARNFVDGLVNGLLAGIDAVVNAVIKIANLVLGTINEEWQIHSPSLAGFEKGWFLVQGIAKGILSAASFLVDVISSVFSNALDFIKNIDFKTFIEAGKNIVTSIGESIESTTPTLWRVAKALGEKLVDIFEAIDMGTIVASVVGYITTKGFFRITDILEKFASPFEGLGKLLNNCAGVVGEFKGFIKDIRDVLDGLSFNFKAKAIKDLAISIAIIAGALLILANIPEDGLNQALSVLIAITVVMAALLAVMGTFNVFGAKLQKTATSAKDSLKSIADMVKLGTLIMSFGVAMLMLAGVAKILSTVSPDDMIKAALLITLFTLVIYTLTKASIVGKEQQVVKAGRTIMATGTAMLMMALVAKIVGGMDSTELGKAITMITLFGLIISGLLLMTRVAGTGIEHAGKTLRQIAVAMLLLVLVSKIIATMEPEEMGKATIGLIGLSAIITGLTAATRLAGGQRKLQNASKMLTAMGTCMLLIAVVAKIIAGMTWEELGKAAIGVTFLSAIITGLIAATKLAGGGAKLKNVAATLIAISIAIGILAGIAVIMGYIDLEGLAKGITAVGILASLMALMIYATKGSKDVSKNLTKMTIIIGILAVAAVILSELPTEKLAASTVALTAMLLSLSALFKSTGSIKTIKMGTFAAILSVVIVLAVILAYMSELPNAQALIPIAVSLSGLLTAFSASIFILGKTGRISTTVGKNIGSLLGIVVALAAILSAMSFLPNPQNLIPIATSLSILMLAFSTSMTILGTVGRFATTVSKSLTPMMMVVAGLAAILGLLAQVPDPNAMIPIALALSTLMIAFSASLVLLSVAGAISTAVAPTIGPLLIALGVMSALAVGIGALMSLIPGDLVDKWKDGLMKFGELLSTLAYVLGDIIGSFIGGIAAGVMSGLPAIGQSLSDFATNSSTFVDLMKNVDDSVIKGAGVLAAAVMAFSIADNINGLSSLMGVGSGLGSLGSQLSQFIINAADFIEGAKDVSPDSAEGVKHLTTAILALTAANVLEGLTKWISGGSSIADFGKDIKALGPAIKQFATDTQGVNGESVKGAAEAASILMEMANNAPNEGGLWGKIFGENNLGNFADDLKSFGKALVDYSAIVSSGINTEAIKVSVSAGKSLSEMAESIPNGGGLFADLFGDNDLQTFGSKLVQFGRALISYSAIVSAGINSEGIKASVEAGKALSGMAEAIPDSGGLFSGLFGDNDLGEFGRKLVAFGTCLNNYSKSVVGLDTSSISISIFAAQQLSRLAEALPSDGGFWSIFKNDTISMTEFGTQIVAFGTAIKNFSDSVAGTDSGAIHSAISAGNRLIGFINNLVDLNIEGVANFKSAMTQLGETSLDGFVRAFTNATESLTNIGVTMMKSIVNGVLSSQVLLTGCAPIVTIQAVNAFIESSITFMMVGQAFVTNISLGMIASVSLVSTAANLIVNAASSAVRTKYADFYSAGSYCVDGFVAGITWNTFKATNAGWALGQAALNAAKAALREASPSKAFYEVGDYGVIGFVNAFTDGLDASEKAGSDIAKSALNGLGNTMSQIKDSVDSEIDASPTIRPVLDLTNIQNGANSISGMFAQQTVALAGINADYARVNAPVGLADLISQLKIDSETSNKEVVDAITNLRGDFGSLVGAISGLHIRMDSGTVVGELIGKIDNSLGQIASYKGRGN